LRFDGPVEAFSYGFRSENGVYMTSVCILTQAAINPADNALIVLRLAT